MGEEVGRKILERMCVCVCGEGMGDRWEWGEVSNR